MLVCEKLKGMFLLIFLLLKTKCSRIEYRVVLFTVNTRCILLLDLCLGHEIQAGIQSWH